MDQIDHQIIQCLSKNAKQNIKDISQQVGLSVSPTFERIKKLERNGVIQKYTIDVAPEFLGRDLIVMVQIVLERHSKTEIDQFKKTITSFDEVIECFHISGNFDYLVKIGVKDIKEYQAFLLDKLSTIKGISNVTSSFVMESF